MFISQENFLERFNMHILATNHVCVAFQVATAITPYFIGVYYIVKGANIGGKIAFDRFQKYLKTDEPKTCEFKCNSCAIYKFIDQHLIKLRKEREKMELGKASKFGQVVETGHEYIIHPSPMGVPNPPRIFSRIPDGIAQILAPINTTKPSTLSPPLGLECIISARHDKFKLNSTMKEKFKDQDESSEEGEVMSVSSDSWDDLRAMMDV